MSAKLEFHGPTPRPRKAAAPSRVRDAREGTRDDEGTDTTNNDPPDHRNPTKGVAKFLWDVDVDDLGENWIEEIPAAYVRWRASGDPQQTDVSGWLK